VTAVAEHVTTGRTVPARPPAEARRPAWPPRLAEGVELLGAYKNSAYSQPPSLVRRADGQVIQMSPLLYQVACRIDGSRGPDTIAALVSADLGRSLDAGQVRYLITAKLLPLGVVTAGGVPRALPKANPLFALKARGTLLPERIVNLVGAFLRPLFQLPVVVAVVSSMVAVDYWLFAVHGLGGGIQQVLHDPVDLLIVLGLSLVAAVFHECGHATGCRYGGARPGVIGVGIYLVWPSFFTNVTDSYRLSRAGRLRTDLGGLYFNLIFMLALAGIYVATSAQVLLLVIAVTHLEMLDQLLPIVRFDGYFILSDLIGVPDLFARVVPIVKSALPAGRRDPRVAGLRRSARVVVTGWVLCVIPLLTFTLGYLLLYLPGVGRALWGSARMQAQLVSAALGGHHYAVAAVGAIGVVLVILPGAGSLYVAARLARLAAALGRRWSVGRPVRRRLAAAAGLAVLTGLAAFWTMQGQFRGW
jgi:putative peptide zinc metalloprotease protein